MLNHLRYSVRQLRRNPSFATVAVATLALGIGVNAAVFSVTDAVLLEPLPYQHAERLVSLWESRTAEWVGSSVAPANLADYRAARSFTHVAGFTRTSMTLTNAGPPEQLRGEAVTWNLFDTLGVRPSLGRTFRAEEDRRGAARVVILTNSLWRVRFGADPFILGRAIVLNDEPHEVIGVMPEAFQPLSQIGSGFTIHCFVPAAHSEDLTANRAGRSMSAVARLSPDVSIGQARAELEGISHELGARFSVTAGMTARLAPLREAIVGDLRLSLIILLSAAALVLLIACVNVANLMIVRAIAQRREVAIRMALGATRAHITLDLALRGMLLGVIGGAAGLVCGLWTRDVLVSMAPSTFPGLELLGLNWRVLAVTTALSIATGTVAGLVPSLQVLRRDTVAALQATALTTSGARSTARWRGLLMAAEIAAALMLAVGAGLLARSLARLTAVDLGFQPAGVLVMTLRPPDTRYPDQAARATLFGEVERQIAAIPGVQSVAFASEFPLRGGSYSAFLIDGQPMRAGYQIVSPGYFATLGIPLVRGRGLTAGDRHDAPLVAVVSESFARRFFPRDPLGQRFRRGRQPSAITIVGVVADARRDGKEAAMTPQVYIPAAQTGAYAARLSEIAVRAAGDPYALLPTIQRAIWSVDRDQPVTNVQTLADAVAQTMAARRFNMTLLSALAALAFLLALVGVYGVVAHAAEQRTREIGIRVALGADGRRVIALIVAGTLKWTFAGVAAGLAGAILGARFMRALLFGVLPYDVLTFAAAGTLMVLVALGASYIPARRAALVDPVWALRSE